MGLSVLAATSLVTGNVGLLTTGAAAATCSAGDHATLIQKAADLSCTLINVTADITFAEGGPVYINHDVTIQGDYTIDADSFSRIFIIESGYYYDGEFYSGDLGVTPNNKIDVTIDGLTLTNGNTEYDGGAIFGDYTYAYDYDYSKTSSLPIELTLNDVTITNSEAYEGGGVYIEEGNVTITGNSTFTGNYAYLDGGAVYVDNGNITISGTATFTNNVAYDDDGAAIYLQDGNLTISGTATFTNNDSDNDGGAIYVETGNILLSGTTTFTNNNADSDGGAIYIEYGDLTISGTATFTGNTGFDGGAVYLNNGDLFITGTSTFSTNIADDEGGAIYVDNGQMTVSGNATFTSNVAGDEGGAIYMNYGGDFILSSSGTVTFTSNDAGRDGGALYVDNDDVLLYGTATFTSNDAGLDGTYSGSGGAINAELVVITKNATFTGNTATDDGGAILSEGVIFTGGSTATFTNNSSYDFGGAISAFYVFGEGDATATFTSNETDTDSGGAIHAWGVQIWDDTKFSFINNYSGNSGGAISVVTGQIHGAYFGENEAHHDGGAIYASGSMGIENTTFFQNTAGYEGGAIFTNDDGSEVIFSTFADNSATGKDGDTPGQSIYTSGTFKLFGNIFASSTSDLAHLGEGGGAGTPEFQDLGGNLSSSEADAAELVHETSKIVTYAELTLAATPAVDSDYPNSTRTIQISTDSLAADAVDIAELAESIALLNLAEGGLVEVDQRGAARTLKFDAGAYEAGDSTYQKVVPIIEVAPKVVLPAAPNRVAVKSVGRGIIQIDWTQPATSGTGKIIRYEIYRNGKKIATIASSKRTFRDTGLDSSQSYTYRIVTVGTQGKSIKSVNSQSVFPRR